MLRQTRRPLLTSVAVACCASLGFAAEFHPVKVGRSARYMSSSLNSYLKFSGAGMSADGRVIVGAANGPAPGVTQAYRWTADGGVEWIDPYRPPPPEDGSPEARAYAASYDGSVVVGSSYIDKRYVINYPWEQVMGFRWEGGVQTDLPWLPPDDEAYPLDVNYDGSIAVGASWETEVTWLVTSMAAARWINGEPEDLGKLQNGPLWYDEDAYAKAVSADGSIIVGQSGEEGGYWRPFVWRDGNMEPLGTLTSSPACPSGTQTWGSCDAVEDISGDGITAVGYLDDGSDIVPVRWSTIAREPYVLPLLGDDTTGRAYAVSHEGSMIVGTSGGKGVVWMESFGYTALSIDTLLRSLRLGDDIAGWALTAVTKVSATGMDIAGDSTGPDGSPWIWHADLRNPQPNDACAFAQWIGGGPVPTTHVLTTLGSLRDATVDGASACEFEHGPDLWYTFSAPVNGYLYLETCGTAYQPDPAYDLVMSVHEGTCPGGSANTVWCTDECAGPACAGALPCIRPEHLHITAGENYLVRIAKKAGAASAGTDFELKSQFLPDTDACDDAFIVDVPGPDDEAVLTLGLTSHATVETTPVCDQERQDGPGVWYKVIGTGRVIVADTLEWTDYDTKLSVFCGGCGGLDCVTANDDYHYPEVLGSSVSWCSQWGAVYHILVHGKGTDTGNFGLKLWDGGSCMPAPGACAPPNDSCEDAVNIAPGDPAEIIGDNTGATWDTTASCSASYDDVWYSYTAECEGVVQIDTCQPDIGTLQQTALSVYDACGGTELDCDFDPAPPCLGRSIVTTPTTPGQDFWIRVANVSADSALDGTFPLRIQEFPDGLSLASGMLPDAIQGQYYAVALPITGGCPPYIVDAVLPPTLRFRYSLIHGTPATSGVFTIPMTVYDQGGSSPAEGTMTLRVLPTNDDCVDAIPLTEGGMHFGNPDATTDGPDEPFGCNFSDYTHIESDIWFCYTSSCEGRATASLCDSSYNTKMAVYSSCRCGGMLGSLLACDDDTCGLQSEVSFDVHEGWDYAIRIGGYAGTQGDGQLTVTCVNKPACCLPDGTCEDLWPEDCTAAGGVVQDARVTCALVTCPSAWQACCQRDGSCADMSPDACWDQFGFPQGEGTTCATTTCAEPEACCYDDSSCVELPAEACTGWDGTPQGAGSTCDTVTCPEPLEACCFDDGMCEDLVFDTCVDEGGHPQGIGTNCATATCPQPQACCFADGHCEDLLSTLCADAGGTPQGTGTECSATECPQPVTACCFADGSCQDLETDACTNQGGSPHGTGTTCATTSCPQPQACCFDDGHCEDLLSTTCSDSGGTPQGTGTECSSTSCPQPAWACCFSDDSCEDLPPTECLGQDGEPQWYRVCADVDCLALRGACCFADGTCQDLRHMACFSAGGMGFYPDETCATHTCSQTVACCFANGTCQDLTPGMCLRGGGEPGPYDSSCSDDCNGDSYADACQVFGDVDLDGTANLNDWSEIVDCLSGPGIPVSGQSCRVCILDCDDDVDLHDMAFFQRAFGEH